MGRTKEENGKKNEEGAYYIVAIAKPLMFLWGQTLAFDSIIRKLIPCLNIPKIRNPVWTYEMWKNVMTFFQHSISNQANFVKLCGEISKNEFGSKKIVPYGQFLDLYYWVGGRKISPLESLFEN